MRKVYEGENMNQRHKSMCERIGDNRTMRSYLTQTEHFSKKILS